MKQRFVPYPDEIRVSDSRRRFAVVIRTPFLPFFGEELSGPDPYEEIVRMKGRLLKHEKRTEIQVREEADKGFFLKHYFYSGFSKWKTCFSRMPKSQREYLALGYLKSLGIPAVEPAGCGARRDGLGRVERCFIITAKENHASDFRAWLRQMETKAQFQARAAVILRSLAGFLRAIHERGFFLLRPNTRNVLIRQPDSPVPEVLFLDQPYARFLSGPAARWGQLKDLSTLLGGALRHLDESVLSDFFDVYLPDPLGGAPEVFHDHLKLAIRARESEHRMKKLFLQTRALLPVFLDKS